MFFNLGVTAPYGVTWNLHGDCLKCLVIDKKSTDKHIFFTYYYTKHIKYKILYIKIF